MKKIVLMFITTSMYLFAITKFVAMYRADVSYAKAKNLLTEGHMERALVSANKAIELNPSEPRYYRERSKIYLLTTLNQNADTTKVLKQLALEDLENAYKLNTKNLATIRNSISLYYFLSTKDISEPASIENVDVTLLPNTESFYRQTKADYPNDVGVFVSTAKYEKRLGLHKEYETSIERIKELRSDLFDWHESLQ